MKLNEVQAFVTVAETGSIQAAAARLHLTQSAVSRLVQRLETDLRGVLFDRQTKPLSLTHDGRMALELGRNVLDSARAFSEAMSPAGEPAGALRLGAAHALATLVTAGPLDLLLAQYPRLAVQISGDWTGALLDRLSAGGLEAAIIMLPPGVEPRRELVSRRLREVDISIVGSRSLTARRWRSVGDLNEVGWVIQPEGCGYRTALAQALERLSTGPIRVAVEAFGQELQLSAIARSAGFGLLPTAQLAAAAKLHDIRAVSVPDFRLAAAIWFVRAPHLRRLAAPLDAIEALLAASE